MQADPMNGRLLGFLAVIDASLGNKEEAVLEALRACELWSRPTCARC